jgi:hypothetical protein
MDELDQRLRSNLEDVRARMAAACARAERSSEEVLLVAVTKTVGSEVVRRLSDLGVNHVGENRVQQAQAKHAELGGSLGLHWHMIGHLQRNKVNLALELFERCDSVDSVRLAEAIDRRVPEDAGPFPVLLECNVSGEESKYGIAPEELPAVLDAVVPLDGLRLEGLMTMAPFVDDAETVRPLFAALRRLRDEARERTGLPLEHLSMGMTQDFEVAIEEGATMVRVGSALFRGL